MFAYLWKRLRSLFLDEEEGKVLFATISRSVMTYFGVLGGIIVASGTTAEDGFDLAIVLTWGVRDWGLRLGAATVTAFPMLIRGGQKNLTAEQTAEQLREAGYQIIKKDAP